MHIELKVTDWTYDSNRGVLSTVCMQTTVSENYQPCWPESRDRALQCLLARCQRYAAQGWAGRTDVTVSLPSKIDTTYIDHSHLTKV